MRFAYTHAPGKGETDALLAALAERLADDGLRPLGAVQTNTDRTDGRPCDMDLKILPEGPVIRISLLRPVGSVGCRLDADQLERSTVLAAGAMEAGGDVFLLNKFGEREASGGGFREVLAEAVAREIPVLVGVNPSGRDGFAAFAGGLAEELEPNLDALAAWVTEARAEAS
ncbi:MAG: DUF2478 domain-containing protein [Pseudomonadota bacterium]